MLFLLRVLKIAKKKCFECVKKLNFTFSDHRHDNVPSVSDLNRTIGTKETAHRDTHNAFVNI